MSALKNALVKIPVREQGGAHGSKGHDFQRHWALCRLIEEDTSGSPFLMLLEHHEDVVVLNHEQEPTAADFFQLKKKESGNWTLTALLKVGQSGNSIADTKHSILAKLFFNSTEFEGADATFSLVSNACFGIPMKDASNSKDKRTVIGEELNQTTIDKIRVGVANELGVDQTKIDIAKLVLNVTDLSLHDLRGHAIGKISQYLELKYDEHAWKPSSVYRLLFSEVSLRASSTVKPSDFAELVKHKGIGKSLFDEMLSTVVKKKIASDPYDRAHASLIAESVSANTLYQLRSACDGYGVDRLDYANSALSDVAEYIVKQIKIHAPTSVRLYNLLVQVAEEVRAAMPGATNGMTDHYLMAIAIYTYFHD